MRTFLDCSIGLSLILLAAAIYMQQNQITQLKKAIHLNQQVLYVMHDNHQSLIKIFKPDNRLKIERIAHER